MQPIEAHTIHRVDNYERLSIDVADDSRGQIVKVEESLMVEGTSPMHTGAALYILQPMGVFSMGSGLM